MKNKFDHNCCSALSLPLYTAQSTTMMTTIDNRHCRLWLNQFQSLINIIIRIFECEQIVANNQLLCLHIKFQRLNELLPLLAHDMTWHAISFVHTCIADHRAHYTTHSTIFNVNIFFSHKN